VIHLGDGGADTEEDASPSFIADSVAKTAINTDAKCRKKANADDYKHQQWEQTRPGLCGFGGIIGGGHVVAV